MRLLLKKIKNLVSLASYEDALMVILELKGRLSTDSIAPLKEDLALLGWQVILEAHHGLCAQELGQNGMQHFQKSIDILETIFENIQPCKIGRKPVAAPVENFVELLDTMGTTDFF